MPRGRPRRTEPVEALHVYIPKRLSQLLDVECFALGKNRARYGMKSQLITKLLTDYFNQRKEQQHAEV